MHQSTCWLSIFLLLAGPELLRAEELASPPSSPDGVLEEVPFTRGNGPILIPVKVGKRTCSLAVQTGYAHTVFGPVLQPLLGKEIIEQEVVGRPVRVHASRFAVPEMRIGTTQLRMPEGVEFNDLAMAKDAMPPIDGVLGMDALRSRIVQLDFDKQVLRLLASVPADAGTKSRIRFEGSEKGTPTVVGVVPRAAAERFAVATGWVTPICLDEASFEELASGAVLRRVAPPSHEDERSWGELTELRIAGLVQRPVRVAADAFPAIGLGFLDRFLVTFDFPGEALYLKPRASK